MHCPSGAWHLLPCRRKSSQCCCLATYSSFCAHPSHGLQGHQAALHLLCCREANTLQQIAQPLSISLIRMEGGSANNSFKGMAALADYPSHSTGTGAAHALFGKHHGMDEMLALTAAETEAYLVHVHACDFPIMVDQKGSICIVCRNCTVLPN